MDITRFLPAPFLKRPPRVAVHLLHDPEDERVPIALADSYLARHGDAATVVTLDRTTGGHFALIDPDHETAAIVRTRLHGGGSAGTMPS